MAFLYEFRRDILQTELVCRRDVVKIGVLDERIETIVFDWTIGEAEYSLGKASVIEGSERAFALRVIQLAQESCTRIELVLEAVAEQSRGSLCPGQIQLLGIVIAILNAARKLQGVKTETDLNAAGETLCFRAGL